jgi:hypothetical protein
VTVVWEGSEYAVKEASSPRFEAAAWMGETAVGGKGGKDKVKTPPLNRAQHKVEYPPMWAVVWLMSWE